MKIGDCRALGALLLHTRANVGSKPMHCNQSPASGSNTSINTTQRHGVIYLQEQLLDLIDKTTAVSFIRVLAICNYEDAGRRNDNQRRYSHNRIFSA